MSSYIDHFEAVVAKVDTVDGGTACRTEGRLVHSWAAFTDARLAWLYGPDHAAERALDTALDLAAWNRLGAGRAAA